MKVLVFGGTKFFGKEIVKFLLEEGHRVTVLSRRSPEDKIFDFVEFIKIDRHEINEIKKIFEKRTFDFLIDNIAYNDKDIIQVKYLFKGKIGHYILTSSCAVYILKKYKNPTVEEEFLGEKDPFIEKEFPLKEYAIGKRAAERVLWEEHFTKGEFQFTIVRPPIVIGPGDPSGRFEFWLKRLLDRREIILPNGGLNVMRFAFSIDLAYSYIKIMERAPFKLPVFNIANFEVINLKTLLLKIAEFLEVEDIKLVEIPFKFLKEKFPEYNPPYSSPPIFIPSVEKARREINLKDSGIDEMIKETVKYFLKMKTLQKDPLREKEIDFAKKFKNTLKML